MKRKKKAIYCKWQHSVFRGTSVNVAITQYHEVKKVEMLQFIDSFTNFCTGRSKNVVRNDVLGAHFVQTLSQQRARTRQINMSELCEASSTGEKK